MRINEPRNLRPYDQQQSLLFPADIRSLIDDDDLCIIIDDVVKTLDLTSLYQKVSYQGNPPYHPAMMVKIIFYAYSQGIFSSRKIAKAVKESVPLIYLAAWQQPDFRTISDFRKNNLKELDGLFVQIVMICQHLGMVKLGHVSIDGSKFKANASDDQTYDQRRIQREIEGLLKTADEIDRKEDKLFGSDKTGEEIPEEICDQKKRIEKIRELEQKLTHSNKEKINKTDLDAVFMKTSEGIKTAYNAQIAADEDHQVIVACDVTNEAADVDQLFPMIDQSEQNTSKAIESCSADSGYSSGENLKAMDTRKIDAYIPDRGYQAQARGKPLDTFDKDNFVYDEGADRYICPEGREIRFSHLQKRDGKEPLRIYQCSDCGDCQFFGHCTTNPKGRTISRHPYEKELKQMRAKLDSTEGQAVYKKRKHIVEPVFGQIKSIMGFTSFHLRGFSKVKGEFKLISIAHNLRKIWLYLKRKAKSVNDFSLTSLDFSRC